MAITTTIKPISENTIARVRQLQWMFFDVDGVMTDGGLFYSSEGEAMKRFNVLDGHGIKLLKAAGVRIGMLSGRQHRATESRAKELGFDCVVLGNHQKGLVFDGLVQSLGLDPLRCGHMGDDLPDLEVFQKVGFCATVPHAMPEVLAQAQWVSSLKGGHGAVRQCCDFILSCQK
jgi:3-deoxy-D-manno-octulosonate 8-phosphate phosphatase (KDO 8-P phosphatase)